MKKWLLYGLMLCIVAGCASKLTGSENRNEPSTTSRHAAMKFDFGGKAGKGFVPVKPADTYNETTGFGFSNNNTMEGIVHGNGPVETDGFVSSAQPFYFSVKVPEGNYNVRVWLGDANGRSVNAIRAECRRMMVNRLETSMGETSVVEFTIHVRDSIIRTAAGEQKVRLKPREISYLHWDDKLTLEFNGSAPKVSALEITPAGNEVTTMFLAGNSTEVDQAEEPYAAWGQMVPSFFVPGKVAVANYAESGESLSSFIAARRFAKTLSLMKPGDYAFVQFGHNDQKQKGEGIGAFTSFKKNLHYFIEEVRKKGGHPVLVTSMQRRSFDSTGRIMETLGDYPAAVRQTAKEENVPLIDLNTMSKTMYEAWGPKESIKAFVHFPANTFPGQKAALADNTHFTPFGANEIARLVVKGIRENVPGLAKFIKPGVPVVDPAQPGSLQDFYWPLSPSISAVKPDGN